MTNLQRDELLISLSKSVNNLQELMIDTKKELKGDIKALEARQDEKIESIRADMKIMEKGIRADMKTMEEGIRADMKTMEEGIRADIKADIIASEKRQTAKLVREMHGVAEIFHDTWNRMA